MKKPRHPSALALVAGALASIFQPPLVVTPSAWAERHLVVADGPRAGGGWDPKLTPQMVPILDALAAGSPWNKVALRKSSQVGATVLGIGWMGTVIAMSPARAMIIFPTVESVREYSREKLSPSIEQSPELRRRVRGAVSRSNRGSTSMSKSFAGGSITLTGANSGADLRSKTVKYQHRDEVDGWPLEIEGEGDPEELADARFIAFHATGDYMAFVSSTPTIKGASRIDAAYEAGDQRNWYVKCPHCGFEQKLVFGGKDVAHGLKFNEKPPYEAHYVCKGSGCIIAHAEKPAMVRAGRYVAENPEGQYPSFHVDAVSSLLTTWDKIAEKFMVAKDNPSKLRVFVNTWLGESWEERGDAPEWKLLLKRQEQYPRGTIPVGALLFTLGVDVQGNGLFYEVVGWGADRQSWSIDAGFLEGDTGDPDNLVWQQLTTLAERRYPDAYGNVWPVDLIGVDAGFNTDAVKNWVRRHPKAKALKGEPGWYRPAIGTPAKTDVTYKGKKRKKGALIWPVGTWALKAEFYAFLRKDQPDDGAEIYPSGYVHIAQHNDERWCRQVVAENLKERESKGRKIKEWVANGDNHFHDCRIYAMALMVHEAGYWTEDQWKLLAQQRGVRERPQGDLFAKPVAAAPAQTAEQAPAPAVAPAPAAPPRKRTSSAERIKNMFARDRY